VGGVEAAMKDSTPRQRWDRTLAQIERLREAYAALDPKDRERIRTKALREGRWLLEVFEMLKGGK
jgi:hypothetical protein